MPRFAIEVELCRRAAAQMAAEPGYSPSAANVLAWSARLLRVRHPLPEELADFLAGAFEAIFAGEDPRSALRLTRPSGRPKRQCSPALGPAVEATILYGERDWEGGRPGEVLSNALREVAKTRGVSYKTLRRHLKSAPGYTWLLDEREVQCRRAFNQALDQAPDRSARYLFKCCECGYLMVWPLCTYDGPCFGCGE